MKTLAVFGAGMQGIAAAYDAAAYGDFEHILLVDSDIGKAIDSAERVNTLLATSICEPVRVDASSVNALTKFVPEVDLIIGALPYGLHPQLERAALGAGCSAVDMGQDTDTALHIHSQDAVAKEKGIAIVTDCGLAPGLVNLLAADLLAQYPGAQAVRVYCGGLPAHPVGPLGYVLRFSMNSVIGEYSEEVIALREGKVVHAEPLHLEERIQFEGVGELEAFTTSGGSGTAPFTFQGKVDSFEYKTLRYPGHLAAMRLFRDCGFWSEERSPKLGITPRQAFTTIMEEALDHPEVKDIVLVRVELETADETVRLEMLEKQDPSTGFTAMERLTGFSTSIIALEIAAGRIPPGCYPCETAMEPCRFQQELRRRGFEIRETHLPR